MKKVLLFVACALMVTLATSSCQTGYSKSSYVSALEKFVNDVEKNGMSFSDKDWAKADERMEAFKEKQEKYLNDFSKDEKRKVSRMMRRYKFLKIKYTVKGYLEDGKSIMEEGEELMEDGGSIIGEVYEDVREFGKVVDTYLN